MSRALVCDQCAETLPLNGRGEHEGGEDAAWISLTIATSTYDLCTRACVAALLGRDDVIAAHDEYTETITGIARVVRDDKDADDDDSEAQR